MQSVLFSCRVLISNIVAHVNVLAVSINHLYAHLYSGLAYWSEVGVLSLELIIASSLEQGFVSSAGAGGLGDSVSGGGGSGDVQTQALLSSKSMKYARGFAKKQSGPR